MWGCGRPPSPHGLAANEIMFRFLSKYRILLGICQIYQIHQSHINVCIVCLVQKKQNTGFRLWLTALWLQNQCFNYILSCSWVSGVNILALLFFHYVDKILGVSRRCLGSEDSTHSALVSIKSQHSQNTNNPPTCNTIKCLMMCQVWAGARSDFTELEEKMNFCFLIWILFIPSVLDTENPIEFYLIFFLQ